MPSRTDGSLHALVAHEQWIWPWLVSSRTAAGLLKLSDTAIKLEERGNLGDVVSLLTDIAEAAVDPVAEQ